MTLAEVVGVMFAAAIFRTTFGFGEALIAVPLLALIVPVKVAAPVAVLASIVIAAFAVVRDWRHIELRSTAWLVGSTLFGLPVGLLLLKCVPERSVFGGSYGMNGPPLAIYGSLRDWPPERFRATLQGYFLPASYGPRR
ncbi:MAG TPA: sulfite exporter TauE/SafE family protein [Polyangia bacterium]